MGHRKSHKNPLTRLFGSHNKKRQSRQQQQQERGELSPLLTLVEGNASDSQSQRDHTTSLDHGQSLGSNIDSPYHHQNYQHRQQYADPEIGKKDYWKILREKVKRGDLLLHGMGGDNLVDHTRKTESTTHQHEHNLQEAIEEIRKGMEFGLWHCLVAIVVYLGIAVACFNTIFEPSWSCLDSIYFAVVTFSTVGYGDEVPTTHSSMIFTCFYALSGVAILGIALGILGSNLVDAQEAMANKAGILLKNQVLSVFDPSSQVVKARDDVVLDEEGNSGQDATTMQQQEKEQELLKPSFFRSSLAFLKRFLPLLGIMLGMAYWIGTRAGWSLLESFYFLIVTATTVGYGDFTPKSDEEKLISLLFIPIAVGTMGVWLGGVANIIVESRSARYRRTMGMKELTQHDLDIMDRDHDGTVTRAEFLEFMLVAMNKIDQTLVDELRQHFDRLDADGTGELTKQDLIEVARKKLKRPVHKLRLSMYKESLMGRSRRGRRGGVMAEWRSQFFSTIGFANDSAPSSSD